MKARALILGVLHRGDFHPYEIRRRIENAMVECYIDVDVGTLYYAINQLEKEGLIVARSHERVARGGMRTIYAITEEGRTAFRELLHRQFDEEGPVAQTLYGALLFLHLADLARVEESLRRRSKVKLVLRTMVRNQARKFSPRKDSKARSAFMQDS